MNNMARGADRLPCNFTRKRRQLSRTKPCRGSAGGSHLISIGLLQRRSYLSIVVVGIPFDLSNGPAFWVVMTISPSLSEPLTESADRRS
jgi:hypothetical protein